MIFNEIYSAYYNAVAEIITKILEGKTDEKELMTSVEEKAFGESILTILPSLKNEKWQLVKSDMTTPLKHKPTMPLTDIQKQWLKAVSLDRRIQLFGVEFNGLDNVEPLFSPDDYFVYDKYSDGDPYSDEKYIAHFRTVLTAMNTHQNLKIEMTGRKGNSVYARCVPERIEYSEKDDKFRLVTSGCDFVRTVNIARITRCRIYNGETVITAEPKRNGYETVTLRVHNERNTLERCMLHFAHFEKRAEKIDNDNYLLYIKYDADDSPEMVIRILSFGPLVEVLEPQSFKNLVIDKLKKQKDCGL